MLITSLKHFVKSVKNYYIFVPILIKTKIMFKIINKKTGFFYYMNPKEVSTFVFRNNIKKYTIQEVKEYNFLEIAEIIGIVFLLVFMFFLLYGLLWIV